MRRALTLAIIAEKYNNSQQRVVVLLLSLSFIIIKLLAARWRFLIFLILLLSIISRAQSTRGGDFLRDHLKTFLRARERKRRHLAEAITHSSARTLLNLNYNRLNIYMY
jgi:hypothetical protein